MKKIITLLVTFVLTISCVFGLTACGKDKIGVQADTTGYYYVTGDSDWGFKGLGNYEVMAYKTPALAIQALKNKQVKYVICDKDPAKIAVSTLGGVKIIPIDLNTEEYGFGVDKDQPALLTSVNSILDSLTQDGTIATIFANYNDPNYKPAGVTSATYDDTKKDTQLVISTHTGFKPFEYIEGTKYYGVDIEICKLIADSLKMELVIKDMEFGAVITSVGKNGVDMAAAAITIKEVRKQSVNFATPYYTEAAQVLVVLENDTTFDNCTTKEEIVALLNK